MIPLQYYYILSVVLFIIGALGVLLRRNVLLILMCLELMLAAANLSLVASSRYANTFLAAKTSGVFAGQIYVFLIFTVAAAEVALGLALALTLYRVKKTTNIDDLDEMRW